MHMIYIGYIQIFPNRFHGCFFESRAFVYKHCMHATPKLPYACMCDYMYGKGITGTRVVS